MCYEERAFRSYYPPYLRLVLLADVYILMAAVGIQSSRSVAFQLVAFGLVSAAFVFANLSKPLPITPSIAAAIGIEDWSKSFFS